MAQSSRTITFKPARRRALSLIIGMVGGTGSGKTYSAMRLASGLAGGKRFACVDTEAGRAQHYADDFAFDHCDLAPPFRPEAYQEAILAADAAGYPVIMIDSFSHEWAGEGGVLDWQEEELDRMAGKDWKKREACKMAAWIAPKMGHKKMVQRLLQVRAHLIVCLRAEEKLDVVRDDKGKMQIVPKKTSTGLDGWVPVAEKNLPYELTMSFLLLASNPGVPLPIKLERQHRAVIALDKPLDEAAGKKFARWAAGDEAPKGEEQPDAAASLLSLYRMCAEQGTLEALEKRRAQIWPTLNKQDKAALKAAADEVSARVKQEAPAAKATPPADDEPPPYTEDPTPPADGPQYDEASAIEALGACMTIQELLATWKKIVADFIDDERDIPLPVEARYQELREGFEQQEELL